MDHGLMVGMLIGGILMSVFPIALFIVMFVVGFRLYRAEQSAERGEAEVGAGGVYGP
jgi:hypothetical protein